MRELAFAGANSRCSYSPAFESGPNPYASVLKLADAINHLLIGLALSFAFKANHKSTSASVGSSHCLLLLHCSRVLARVPSKGQPLTEEGNFSLDPFEGVFRGEKYTSFERYPSIGTF